MKYDGFECDYKVFNIKGKSQQEALHFNVTFASEQESAEGVVLFQNAKCTLYLNGAIDAEQNTFIADDVIKRLPTMF